MVAAIEANSPHVCLQSDERLCVPIAGLMHDIGHGPFSHLFDGRYIPAVHSDKTMTKDDTKRSEKFQVRRFYAISGVCKLLVMHVCSTRTCRRK